MIRYDIVWQALIDLEDRNIFHSSFISMYNAQSDLYQSEEAVMNLLRIVDFKVNLIRHVIKHLENNSFLEMSVREVYVAHCMSENCFLLDGLVKLRRRCIDVMDVQVCLYI
jgi:hypothetical protein